MRAALSLLFVLLATAGARAQLKLEFVQQGDPSNPRALIVIHRGLSDRSDLKPFFAEWGRSWALQQFCSVYSYSYPADLNSMPALDALGANLLTDIQTEDFDRSIPGSDPINPLRTVVPSDSRQPPASFFKAGKLVPTYVLAQGTGGLVAREMLAQAQKKGLKMQGVTYVGTPLDGVPMMSLNASLRQSVLCAQMGLTATPGSYAITHLSPGWLQVCSMWDAAKGWAARYAPAYGVKTYLVYGTTTPRHLGADRVQYGRGRGLSAQSQADFDGWVTRHSAYGDKNGPTATVALGQLAVSSPHSAMIGLDPVYQLVIQQMLTKATWVNYLMLREGIELYFHKTQKKPLGFYYDESSTPVYKPAYALPGALYQFLWIGAT